MVSVVTSVSIPRQLLGNTGKPHPPRARAKLSGTAKKPATSTASAHRPSAPNQPRYHPFPAPTKRRRRARAAINKHPRPPRSPPPYLADQSSVFVTAMMATVTGESGHSLGVLTVSRAVFLSRRSHTRTCHMRAFRRCIRHLALLLVEPGRTSGPPECPRFYSPTQSFGSPPCPQAVTWSNHTCCFVPHPPPPICIVIPTLSAFF